jgi:hypothetical protein
MEAIAEIPRVDDEAERPASTARMAMNRIAFTEPQIVKAIQLARRGIGQYLDLMDRFPSVDVSTDRDFQRRYNDFYKVSRKSAEWYKAYYDMMHGFRDRKPAFGEVLDRMRDAVGSCEASFCSKLVATLDANCPVWDKFVLDNLGVPALRSQSSRRFEQAKLNYGRIVEWYRDFLASETGRNAVRIFDSQVPQHARITNLKKIDFVLWQTRPNEAKLAESFV